MKAILPSVVSGAPGIPFEVRYKSTFESTLRAHCYKEDRINYTGSARGSLAKTHRIVEM